MAKSKKICRHLHLPLQSGSSRILKVMNRHYDKEKYLGLVEKIRKAVPDISLTTDIIVGFPGETEEDFRELVDFVKWARFERMGAFAYSAEDGTYSAEHYAADVPQEEKQRRLDKLMAVQQRVSAEVEARKIGSVLKTIVDRKEGEYYIGRTEFCSPEVDPEVLIKSDRRLRVGSFYNVHITDSDDFDLYGEVVD